MEKEYTIKSLEEFNRLTVDNGHLKVIPSTIIQKFLDYKGKITIVEIEKPESLMVHLKIEEWQYINEVLCKIEVIKEDLNKYAKEGIENPDNCTIEKLRQELIKIKSLFGDDWKKEYVYSVDKYLVIKKFVRLFIGVGSLEKGISIENLKLLVDKIEKDVIFIGHVFAGKLKEILNYHDFEDQDCSRLISFILTRLGERYKLKVDFLSINKSLFYNRIIVKNNNLMEFKNMDCRLLKIEGGDVIIRDSVISKIDLTSPEIKSVDIKNISTASLPIFTINKIKLENIGINRLLGLPNRDNNEDKKKRIGRGISA